MPRLIDLADPGVSSLAECVDALSATGFDPRDEESLLHAARQLRRLGNDADFLGDLIVAELAAGAQEDDGGNSYGAQVIMLCPPGPRDFFLRANIWPSPAEQAMRASGDSSFVYGLPHDHNFDFLSLGYFGPGYDSDYWEFDYDAVAGWTGEAAGLRFIGRERLEPGKLVHYRAHVDVHAQLPPESLSVSLNVMHAGGAQGWLDQYRFDTANDRIAGILTHGASEAFLRIAVGLGGAEAIDLAHAFGRGHPSDRMRLAAFSALASVAPDAGARDRLWARAEASGSRLLVGEARLRRGALEAVT